MRQALKLADFLNQHSVTLQVTDYCLSACAAELVPAVNKVEVEPATLFLLHSTLTATYWAARKHHPDFAEAQYGEAARREQSFYKEHGLPLAALYLPLVKAQPTCGVLVKDEHGVPAAYVMSVRYSAYAPSAAVLSGYGVHLKGQDAQAPAEMQRRLGPLMPEGMQVIGATPADTKHTVAELQAALDVPDCRPGEEPKVDLKDLFR